MGTLLTKDSRVARVQVLNDPKGETNGTQNDPENNVKPCRPKDDGHLKRRLN